MRANELRIGNWVQYDGIPYQIESLTKVDAVVHSIDIFDFRNRSLENAQPIELTEEVLLKIGFKKNKHNDWWEYYPSREDEVSILMRDKYTTIEYANLFHCPEDVAEVNYDSRLEFPRRIYLHELQNAYYCLTNNELEIEL